MINYFVRIKNVKGNSYYVVFFRLPTADGKLKAMEKSTGVKPDTGGIREAKKRAKEIVSQYEDLLYSDKSEMLLGDYVADWLERHKANVKTNTYDSYSHMNNRHIKPYFAERGLKLKDIKPMHLQEYVNVKLQEVSPNTVIKHLTLIKTAMQDAVINDLIKSNPAYKVKPPKKEKPKHDFYTVPELRDLLRVSRDTPIEVPIFLAVMFGLRRSECVGLKWSDIDFEHKTLTINGSVTRQKDGGKIIDTYDTTLKTEASHSAYLLNDTVCEYLENLYKHNMQLISNTEDYKEYVCVNEVGERLKLDYITHRFDKLLKQNGLRHIRFHDLRHSVLSILAGSYLMKNVQGYARHANYNITADTYSHFDSANTLAELNTLCGELDISG